MIKIITQSDILKHSDYLEEIRSIIKKGGVIIYPTDTLYGIGCDPFNLDAIRKIFKIKKRMESKGLPILSDNLDNVKKIAKVPEIALQYIERYWPGKLTIIFESTGIVSPEVTGTLDTVAVRIPGNEFTLRLISECGGYLIGTSANESNKEVLKSITEIQDQISGDIDLIIDAGPVKEILPSTILDITSPVPKIIRKGAQDL
ncbi:MAG: threonylcarbamoyl-AMP synthase [Candidatus Lokiarchaeota archaeon]|nr:threonylcarbamoyl-AMP synthase [Candidatus Lokiarchaeota archaeon]